MLLVQLAGSDIATALEWVSATPENAPETWRYVTAFHDLCASEFDADEVEELATWKQRMADGGRRGPCRQSFTFLVDIDGTTDDRPRVLAGIARELYPTSGCALISYIIVSPLLRGRGIALKLIQRSEVELSFDLGQPLTALFADIAQVRDAHHEAGFDPATRQEVWRRLGFVPLRFDLVFPGRMRSGGRYHLAMFVGKPATEETALKAAHPNHHRQSLPLHNTPRHHASCSDGSPILINTLKCFLLDVFVTVLTTPMPRHFARGGEKRGAKKVDRRELERDAVSLYVAAHDAVEAVNALFHACDLAGSRADDPVALDPGYWC